MKAAVRYKYGASNVLSVKEVEIPTAKENEVLIKVHATTVNRTDCHVLTGKPYAMRLFTGLFKPKFRSTGSDFAGEIAGVGKDVQSFITGEKIFGFGGGFGCGSHAQYFILPENKASKTVCKIPGNLTFTEAAACIEGAVYAINSVNTMQPAAGKKALVYGATGAIGTAAIQFLKYYGVNTTAVCSSENAGLMRRLGADKMIDYTNEDYTNDEGQYDFVFDAVGKSSFAKCKRLLKKDGKFATSGGFLNIFLVLITRVLGGKKVVFPASMKIKQALGIIKDLAEKGKFVPVIDRIYPLDEIAEAYTFVASGKKVGNVIINMDE